MNGSILWILDALLIFGSVNYVECVNSIKFANFS